MFLCVDCDAIFDQPKKFVDDHGLDTPPYEEFYGCPLCGGSFVNAVECDGCGDYITGDYVEVEDGRLYCENCYSVKNVEDMEVCFN